MADRFDKRRILLVTQAFMGVLAVALGLLTAFDAAQLWMVYMLSFLLGCATALDNPTRQSFMSELVGREDLANAVSLNSASFNAARVLGPPLAGIVVAAWDVAPAFFLNAASFGAVLLALWRMDVSGIVRQGAGKERRGGVREGLRFVWGTPELRQPILIMAVVATLGINFRVVLPVLARFAFDGGPRTYGLIAAVFAGGSVVGALVSATRSRPTHRVMGLAAAAFGVCALAAALAPTLSWELAALFPQGAAALLFLTTANALVQTRCPPGLQGRVMSLYAVIFLGSTPLGGALVGFLSEVFGPRAGLFLAAASGVGGALLALKRPATGRALR